MPLPMPQSPMTPGGQMPKAAGLPGNPMAGPGGPGGSPMTSPGAGAGNEAATDALIAGIMGTLYKALQAYPLGSKKNGAVLNAIRALSANFAKQEGQALVPAAIQQLAMNAKPAGPLAGARPPGIMPAASGGGGPTPPMGGGAGGPELPGMGA
jgi:hypothetical protein